MFLVLRGLRGSSPSVVGHHVRCLQGIQHSQRRYTLMGSRAERTTSWCTFPAESMAWTADGRSTTWDCSNQRRWWSVWSIFYFAQVILQVLGNVPKLQASHLMSNTWTQTGKGSPLLPELRFPRGSPSAGKAAVKDTALKTMPLL